MLAIRKKAHTPQPSQSNAKNNSNNENSCERSNISGNSTTRPPEGEEHGVATVTATATATATAHSPDSCANNGKNNNEGNEEHLAEVLVLPVDDTKTIATTTTTMIEAPTVEVAANTSARTADIERGNACVVGGRNSCGKASLANEANTTARRGSATAPIAREEEDAEEVWTSESEDGKDVELAGKQAVAQNCCLVNEIEKGGGQFDTNSYINSNKMPAVSATLAVTVTLTSTTVTEAGTAEKSVQRSKSRVRTYLKKCRDRLTGQHQHSAATAAHSTMSEPNGTQGIQATANSAMHLKDEKSKATAVAEVLKAAPKRNSSQSHVLEEDEGEREEKEETPCTCALIATIEWQDDELARTLLPLSEESEDERTAAEEAEAEEEAHSTSELTELVYEDIDFSLTSVLMDSSSSNVSVDQHQSTPLTSVHNRDALTLSAAAAAADVDDSDDLAVEGETRRRQIIEEKEEKEESCQQQPRQMLMPNYNSCPPLVKEAQLAHAIRMDSGTAELIDKHLAAIYPVYMACTRAILIRQARDLLVSSYSACLQSFEMKFLCKFAEIAADLSQRHAIGENVLWRKGWPLTTPTGEVVLHLGSLDNALVRPGDLYLCVKSANKTETPQLFAVWRSAPSDIVQLQQKQQPLHASATGTLTATETADASKIHSYCIDFSATPAPTATTPPTHLSALTLEMLTSDELPQLLQQLLVGVEHSIERVSLNELQMTATTTTTTTTATTAMPLAADVANNNNNGNKININSMLVRCNNSSNSNNNNNNTITNSPKCALRRSELITKNKVLNNKFMLRRLTNRQDSMNSTSSGQSCGSSGSTSSDELLRCNTNSSSTITTTNHNSNHLSAGGSGNGMLVSGNNGCSSLEPLKMSAGSTNSASTSPALPLFCLGNSFPHIDSDEENADEKRSANGEDQFECEIVPPASIGEIPEKLLTTSGIYLPGTSDLKGHPIVTVDAECVLAAGLNCYEIATVLLYYSTIPERISTVNANDRTTLHQQQQPSMQLQQPQQNHQHQSQQPQQSSISRLSTPKTVKEVATSAAQPAAAGTTTTTTTTMPVTSNVTTATAVKSPAHANATTIDNTNTNTNTNSNSNSGSNAATPTFTILIAIEKPSQMCVIDLIYQSLRLLTRQIAYCEILAVCLERNLLQQQQQLQQQPNATTFNNNVAISMVGNGENNNESCIKEQQPQSVQKQQHQQPQQHPLKFISVNEVTTSVAPSQIPYGKLQGLHHHDARKWREFFVALEPFQRQCATAGQRLVAAMSDIRSADLQGLPTRRQLYAQHRALSRALMDSELHNLRKRGALQLARLQELAKCFAATVTPPPSPPPSTAMTTNCGENSHNHNGSINLNGNSSHNNNNNSNRYYYSSSSSSNGCNNNRNSGSGNKLLSTISSISHLGFGGSYSFSMSQQQQQHSQQQQQHQQHSQISQSQNRPAVSKYSTMTSYDGINNNSSATVAAAIVTTVANNAVGGGRAAAAAGDCTSSSCSVGNMDVAIRLHKVTLLFNEVDRAAKRLEQLTEQRRERLRELTRQRALEDEINEVTSWITSDGNDTLQRFANLQFDCETAIKEQEQEFEKYYFISMKHLAKGRDLYDAAINVEALHDSAVNLKSALDCFAEKLESARERIEAASRLQHLLTVHNLEPHVQQEMQRLAEVTGATLLLEKYRQQQQQQLGQEENSNIEQSTTETTENVSRQVVCSDAPTNNNKPNSLNLSNSRHSSNLSKQQQLPQQLQHVAVITSTPVPRMNRLSHRSSSGIGSFDGQTCQCWRESRNMEDMDEMLDVDGEELELEDGEEEQSKIADSGVGGCERCEGNPKLTRVCSCQSLNEAANLYGKSHNSDELDFECYERPVKRYNDIHSPMEANAHLQYHASSLELSKLEELSCLDPKIQKTLLLIMREMIGTERDYVHSLNYVIENYVDELLREDIPQPLRGQRNVIFGNIEKIFEFHKWHFLNELERYERNPLKIGSAFLEMESKFYLYALYNKNKPKSDTLMSEYGTAFFKSKQFELNDKMDLASYLLKPVQRMGKYALLLQQLVKACNAVEGAALQEIAADVEELQRAEEMVKFQLRHGNDLLAMDSLRDCDVNVKEQGRLLRQNEFLVWQGRGGKKSLRQIFLFEDLVLFSKARRFPDQKNLDIYIYKNSIKTSDIGLTAHVGDSKTKFEIWFRKRKPDDTWTMQCMSEDIKNAWTEEISKLLWKQANRNREIRLAEMSSMGIGSKPCLDIRPSNNQINDRSITISQLGKAPKLRHSFAGLHLDGTKNARRPNSLISESSLSSGTSSSSLSTGSSSGHERVGGGSTSSSGGGGGGGCHGKSAAGTISSHHALELINETQTLMLSGGGGGNVAAATSNGGSGANTNTLSSSGSSGRSGRSGHSGRGGSGVNGGGLNGGANNGTTTRSKRSTTLVSQLSMESGILSDISMTPDQEHSDATCSWLNANTVAASASLTIATNLSSPTATSTTATIGCGGGDGGGANSTTVIMRRQRLHHSKQQQQEKHEKHKELQHQQSAPAALQERSSIGGQCNPYLREFKADSVNL
ncbi:PREDICTED: uncharacterized protein LOC108377030 isoform X2 [Rhagoletis zephyria]|uniref:uncharacterized protein LOC108377030 isoform X2 n=1 Tax=Rhagoletis zephyria TaxID=28612 RepID=UPI00081150E7|nr:PREDICTED: uncharacterized protein LOC108377030 isoform X2 [Rhagoletis zephyria]